MDVQVYLLEGKLHKPIPPVMHWQVLASNMGKAMEALSKLPGRDLFRSDAAEPFKFFVSATVDEVALRCILRQIQAEGVTKGKQAKRLNSGYLEIDIQKEIESKGPQQNFTAAARLLHCAIELQINLDTTLLQDCLKGYVNRRNSLDSWVVIDALMRLPRTDDAMKYLLEKMSEEVMNDERMNETDSKIFESRDDREEIMNFIRVTPKWWEAWEQVCQVNTYYSRDRSNSGNAVPTETGVYQANDSTHWPDEESEWEDDTSFDRQHSPCTNGSTARSSFLDVPGPSGSKSRASSSSRPPTVSKSTTPRAPAPKNPNLKKKPSTLSSHGGPKPQNLNKKKGSIGGKPGGQTAPKKDPKVVGGDAQDPAWHPRNRKTVPGAPSPAKKENEGLSVRQNKKQHEKGKAATSGQADAGASDNRGSSNVSEHDGGKPWTKVGDDKKNKRRR
ncbi:hypothetical protein K402DRAFT_223435 [Aulographum hederae CBS 113979]|uniref:Uncharacterized protein n=1 Tax=Aulographum hederae CBS 113979 TaxID=1176131 RepID=A0A6G1GLP2_9PEZI|nr:hypothetical protein K402DRAFT_223435 [Aulographum hederae CBS 113979]